MLCVGAGTMPELDRPVLIVGAPRSGKSVVSRILSEAPEFHYVDEPLGVWNIGFGARADDRRGADEATESVVRAIRGSCRREVLAAGRRRYLDNLAYHALRIPFVARAMPDALIIHVTQQPRGAIPEMIYGWTARDTVRAAVARRASVVKLQTLPRLALRWARNYVRSRMHGRKATWGPRLPGLEAFAATHPVALVAAQQWEGMVSTALDDLSQLDSRRWLDVRYERLRGNFEFEVKRIARFAEVEDPDALLEKARRHVDPRFVNPGRVEPTESEWREIAGLVRPALQRLERLDGAEEEPQA
jgi:hypothetical protein